MKCYRNISIKINRMSKLKVFMIYLFFFIFKITCYKKIYEFDTSTPTFILYSFGFTNESYFDFEITSSRNKTFHIFLIESKQIVKDIANDYETSSLCFNNVPIPFYQSNLNISKNNSRYLHWYGKLNHKALLTPVLVSCPAEKSYLKIITRFRNRDFFFDYRSQFNSLFYACFSIVYFILSGLWIVTILFHSSLGQFSKKNI